MIPFRLSRARVKRSVEGAEEVEGVTQEERGWDDGLGRGSLTAVGEIVRRRGGGPQRSGDGSAGGSSRGSCRQDGIPSHQSDTPGIFALIRGPRWRARMVLAPPIFLPEALLASGGHGLFRCATTVVDQSAGRARHRRDQSAGAGTLRTQR